MYLHDDACCVSKLPLQTGHHHTNGAQYASIQNGMETTDRPVRCCPCLTPPPAPRTLSLSLSLSQLIPPSPPAPPPRATPSKPRSSICFGLLFFFCCCSPAPPRLHLLFLLLDLCCCWPAATPPPSLFFFFFDLLVILLLRSISSHPPLPSPHPFLPNRSILKNREGRLRD